MNIMRRLLFFLFPFLLSSAAQAQSESNDTPWRMKLKSVEGEIDLQIDLYEESIEVKGMEMFGPMNGYLGGNIYGVWMVTSHNIDNNEKCNFRLSNDFGSETQQCELKQENDSIYKLSFKGGVCVKKVVNKKLVKLPSTILFKKIINTKGIIK